MKKGTENIGIESTFRSIVEDNDKSVTEVIFSR
jgi:hypothetical protein